MVDFKGLIQLNESFSEDEKARVVASGRIVGKVSIPKWGVIDSPGSAYSWNNKAGHGNTTTYTDPSVERKCGQTLGPCLMNFRLSAWGEASAALLTRICDGKVLEPDFSSFTNLHHWSEESTLGPHQVWWTWKFLFLRTDAICHNHWSGHFSWTPGRL